MFAFDKGWVWLSGDTFVRTEGIRFLCFEPKGKKITMVARETTADEIIERNRISYNFLVKVTKKIDVMKEYIETGVFNNSTFNVLYMNNKENIYEKFENLNTEQYKYVDVILPYDNDEKREILDYIINKGYKMKSVGEHHYIRQNIEDVNILHMFVDDDIYLLLNVPGGVDELLANDLRSFVDSVYVVDTFSKLKALFQGDFYRYYGNRGNVYD